ncbi:hypothetical protein SARC_00470 [Sphaeroforma arctica JP610]|uniref:ATP synthase subunit g, mitochondrial n=1 Tax=Sphaeroforma arctica JP610 TaxID=667725 RepID=A0A0L0GGI1_9EUKA|nr:hypothetical protein SARC_00470 [Sphaeroforma arctica JP610]KNC87433.1 hypothetical protein SARC_00470 [Sphaeroforma arctica JP610]|eukprot:XP_014161335.1 hypothetical protein SARC_00470 [Sphaeroforma arctica JP610]
MAQAAQKAAQQAAQLVTKNSAPITSRVARAWPAIKTELGPPAMDTWPQAKTAGLKLIESAKNKDYLNCTVKTALTNTMLVAEIGCWFFVGEIIGRGSLIGYSV